ncbi:hypothetical protein BDA96_01G424500 [Sorghum bicolor]|uniref:DUF3511 domain-containing protein n=3 Tax=Sorghum bicolor TaxID=4558 RepID=A0A921S4U6_SORBI|nr:hypothetical protein SORBI_3001G398700 [Sorghum bicolor]KAG0551449.1 hypothetical protein BDA96_01G424500 [Sorghum bicolor]
MAAADYDRAYRPYAGPALAPAGEYDRPYRNEVVPYGDRRLDIVVKPPARSPPPPLPVSTRSGGSGGAGSAWCFSDPEMKRRRRVASYKAYSVEGKVKASFRRGFRWIKAKCSELIHGWYGSRLLLLLPPSPSYRVLPSSSQYSRTSNGDSRLLWFPSMGHVPFPLGNGLCPLPSKFRSF